MSLSDDLFGGLFAGNNVQRATKRLDDLPREATTPEEAANTSPEAAPTPLRRHRLPAS